MVHAQGNPGGALPDQLNPEHRQLSVPECSVLGRKAQQVTLPGLGLPPQIRSCGTFALPREEYTLPHQASDDPRQFIPHVCQALTDHLQATLAGTPPSGLDIT